MKTSIINLSSKFLIAFFVTANLAYASLVAKVHTLKGEAFVVHMGQTSLLKADADLEEGATILVSDDAAVTIGDFFDHRFNLSGGTHLSVSTKEMVLKKGAVWVQAPVARSSVRVLTPNMIVNGQLGEWIVTYDVARRRTQMTAVMGESDVASPLEPAFKYAVSAGMFTLADPEHENGYPRSPTKIGYESLMKSLALFPGSKSRDAGIAQVQERVEAGQLAQVRAPASAAGVATSKGEIIFIQSTERAPASLEGKAQQYFEKKTRHPVAKKKAWGHFAPVRLIGFTGAPRPIPAAKTAPTQRRPASQTKAAGTMPSVEEGAFMRSYEGQQKQQPYQTPEAKKLMDELESF